MRKLRIALMAGLPLAGLVTFGGVTATTAASACTVSYNGLAHLNPKPAYNKETVTADSCGAAWHAKALCKSTPTSGVYEYGPNRTAPGQSTATCPGSDNLSAGWIVIGGIAHQTYP